MTSTERRPRGRRVTTIPTEKRDSGKKGWPRRSRAAEVLRQKESKVKGLGFD